MAKCNFDGTVSAHRNAGDTTRFVLRHYAIVLLYVMKEILSYEVLVTIFGAKYGVRVIRVGSIGHYQYEVMGRRRLCKMTLINPVCWTTVHSVKEEKNRESQRRLRVIVGR